jgi:hypothetical protein
MPQQEARQIMYRITTLAFNRLNMFFDQATVNAISLGLLGQRAPPALAETEGEAKMTAADEPLREMDLAFFEMFDLLLDILVRMGVPKEEFDQQFKNTLEKVQDFPQAKYIIEKMAKIASDRANDLKDLERILLLNQRPKGSA